VDEGEEEKEEGSVHKCDGSQEFVVIPSIHPYKPQVPRATAKRKRGPKWIGRL